MLQPVSRYQTLRELAARLYRLADDATVPSRSVYRSEQMIDEAEMIAQQLRGVFR